MIDDYDEYLSGWGPFHLSVMNAATEVSSPWALEPSSLSAHANFG